jgi:hypothetical protein
MRPIAGTLLVNSITKVKGSSINALIISKPPFPGFYNQVFL